MLYKETILNIVKKKNCLLLKKDIDLNYIIIIDFFNIYCNIVKFNKFKTFSKETFIICMDLILKRLKDYKILIISKNIFEVELNYIKNITYINKNITYIIVEDNYIPRSKNRERDDYVCILFQKYFLKIRNEKSYIISNDKYKNFNSLLDNIKPFNLQVINDGKSSIFELNVELIKKYNLNLKENTELNTCEFTLI